MKLTRHNGRAGKNGAYNPKHNDRRFDIENSEHIDIDRAKQNIYWDCYTGFSSEKIREHGKENDYSFEKIEQIYYFEHYADHIQAQNERNEKTRHTERNRTVMDLLTNNKTCPEESIYQIGTVEESVSGEVLAKIATEFFTEMEEKFGSHVHILDWALHLDEGTPHIHERHVFDCENKYGELCPQQEKALEELGIPLPNFDKKKGRNNNRKQTFDAECRKMLFRICEKHNLYLQKEPSYGGRGYLEKQDFIIEKQKATISVQEEIVIKNTKAIGEQEKKIQKAESTLSQREKVIEKQDKLIAEKNAAIMEKHSTLKDVTMKLEDMETLVDEVAEQAYEKACEVVTDTVRQKTQREDIRILDDYSAWLSAPERTDDKKLRNYAVRRLGALKGKLLKSAKAVMEKITKSLQEPERKRENLEQVKEKARVSVKEKLSANIKNVDEYKSQHYGEKETSRKRRAVFVKRHIIRSSFLLRSHSVRATITYKGETIPFAGFIAALFFYAEFYAETEDFMAENRKYYFLKLKEDFFEQDTIVLLESLKDGVLYSNILMKMYLKSLQFNGFLKVNEHLSLTTEMIATLTRHEVGTVERALKIFLELGLAETTDTGTIYMSQIETLVGKSSTEGERKKLSRIRKEQEKSTPLQVGLSDAAGQSVDICPQNVRTTLDICPPESRDKSIENRDKSLDIRESEREKREKTAPTHASEENGVHFYGRYGNVRLTDQDMEMLKSDFPTDYLSMIEHMSEYMESSGKTYKNHLATMELWKKADMEKAKPKGNGYSYNGNFEEGDSL